MVYTDMMFYIWNLNNGTNQCYFNKNKKELSGKQLTHTSNFHLVTPDDPPGALLRGPGLILTEEGVKHKPDSPDSLGAMALTSSYHHSSTARGIEGDCD